MLAFYFLETMKDLATSISLTSDAAGFKGRVREAGMRNSSLDLALTTVDNLGQTILFCSFLTCRLFSFNKYMY